MSYVTVQHGKVTRKAGSNKMTIDTVRGYYFIFADASKNKHAIFIGETQHQAAQRLEKYCDKYLTDDNYWWQVNYCHGHDVAGRLQWSDFYCGDNILSLIEKIYHPMQND